MPIRVFGWRLTPDDLFSDTDCVVSIPLVYCFNYRRITSGYFRLYPHLAKKTECTHGIPPQHSAIVRPINSLQLFPPSSANAFEHLILHLSLSSFKPLTQNGRYGSVHSDVGIFHIGPSSHYCEDTSSVDAPATRPQYRSHFFLPTIPNAHPQRGDVLRQGCTARLRVRHFGRQTDQPGKQKQSPMRIRTPEKTMQVNTARLRSSLRPLAVDRSRFAEDYWSCE